MYTQMDKTKELFATLKKGTVLTKEQYRQFWSKDYRAKRDVQDYTTLASWDRVIQNADLLNIERIEIFQKVPTSKITTVDVLEMVKEGKTAEEIEKAIYTTIKIVKIKIK